MKILIQGEAKGHIQDYTKTQPNFEVKVQKVENVQDSSTQVEKEALIRSAKEL